MDRRIQTFLRPSRPGSFENDVILFITEPNNLFMTTVLGSYAVSTVGQAVNTFIVTAIKQVCGVVIDGRDADRERSWLDRFPSGDFEAALDAIEPSMKRAHSVIGDGAETLLINRNREPVLKLDVGTKAYVNANIEGDHIVEMEISVGALNVNTGNGRLYLPAVGKTVPFNIVREPDAGTYQALSSSLDRYARGLPSAVLIRCREIFANDDRIKRLVIFGAREVGE